MVVLHVGESSPRFSFIMCLAAMPFRNVVSSCSPAGDDPRVLTRASAVSLRDAS